jgi:diphthamide biosynthesis protein 2
VICDLRMTTLTLPVPLSDDHADQLLTRSITPPLNPNPLLSSDQFYEIERTKKLIQNGGFKNLALQFPDELLHDAAEVVSQLQQLEGVKTFILADTSYGRYLIFEERGGCEG